MGKMKREHWIITILGITACVLFTILMNSCSLYISIEGKKKVEPVVVTPVKETVKPVSKFEPVKKSNYQTIKDEHNNEWLNLPHRESENQLFQPK